MSLLALHGVSKRYRERQREHIVLNGVTLEIDAGEFVAVYGPRRSGRTTLLRVAGGIEAPDAGSVSFQGQELGEQPAPPLGEGIGYLQKTLRAGEERRVLEQVAAPLLARGASVPDARERARSALRRAGGEHCSALTVDELSAGEQIRTALARALVLAPSLLILDEPVATVEIGERDGILTLLRTLAAQDLAILASTGEPEEMAGAHRALTLSAGTLRGQSCPALAPVVAMRRPA